MSEATTLSFSTDQETAKMLDELIWQMTLDAKKNMTRSEVITKLIRAAWEARNETLKEKMK